MAYNYYFLKETGRYYTYKQNVKVLAKQIYYRRTICDGGGNIVKNKFFTGKFVLAPKFAG